MFDKSQWNSAKGVALKNAQDQSRIASIIKEAPNQEVFAEQWERAWRMHWEKTGFTPYELPISDSSPAGEREFLTQARTLEGERSRLRRITNEFEHGFRSLHKLGLQ